MTAYEEVSSALTQLAPLNTITHVAWVAAGGSLGGFWPAHYFVEHESKTLRSQLYTSNEFVHMPPAYVGEDSLIVVCSMRGTKETIEAARVAKTRGTKVIALYVEESELLELADVALRYESIALDASRTEYVNSSRALMLAEALVEQKEGCVFHTVFASSWDKIDTLYRKAFSQEQEKATSWALSCKDASVIHVIGSGPAYGSAYIFSICNIEEMLQIESPCTNSCEWFHGPFEITKPDSNIFLLKSVGRARALDERVEHFLERYEKDTYYVLDAQDLGILEIDPEVREYFNHVLFSPVLNNVYMRALAKERNKNYLSRSYMWQVEY